MRKNNSLADKLTFNHQSKIYYSECKSVRTRYLTNEIKQHEENPKLLHSFIKKLTFGQHISSLQYLDVKEDILCNQFAHFFNNKVNSLVKEKCNTIKSEDIKDISEPISTSKTFKHLNFKKDYNKFL